MKAFVQKISTALTATKARRIIGWTLSGFFVLFIYFLVEMYNYRSVTRFRTFIRDFPKSALLGVLIVTVIYIFLLLLCRKAWVSALILGVLLQICGIIQFLKVALNGDPFVPMDFTMTSQMGSLLQFINVRMPWWAWLLPILLAAYIVLLWLWKCALPKRKGLYLRIVGCIILPTLLVGFLHPKHARDNFALFGMYYEDAALQSSNYSANGFVSAFYLNIATMSVSQPENYSKETVNALLADYPATKAENKPDVIVFLCESFWDVRKLPGTTFSTNPMYFYDELCARENAYSGTLYSTAIGGGTVRTEFDILTGLCADFLPSGASPYIYAKENSLTHISLFKDEGYTTLAMHPYDKKFYTREKAYPFLGFDRFDGESEIIEMLGGEDKVKREREYVSDDSFVDSIIMNLEAAGNDPTFLFALSMENHQTYYPLEQYEIDVQNAALDSDLVGAVNTYAQGVYHSNHALKKLVEYIDNRDKDTVLIFFGDHLPTLGANYAAYRKTGMFNSEVLNTETRKTMYGTPFVIYGNYELNKDVMENTGNEMSDYYLLSRAAQLSGTARTPYMNMLLAEYQSIPYFNERLLMKQTEPVKAFRAAHEMLTYDRLIGNRFSQK